MRHSTLRLSLNARTSAAATICWQSPFPGSASSRIVSAQSSAWAASNPLACQDGHLGGARLRRGGERREPGLVKGKASAGRKWSKARGGGWEGKPKEESQAVVGVNGEWDERVAMVMVAVVAQQSVAPEPPKRGSHSDSQCRSAAR